MYPTLQYVINKSTILTYSTLHITNSEYTENPTIPTYLSRQVDNLEISDIVNIKF